MRNWQKLLIEHGYTARTVPVEYGGTSDILKGRIIAEEFAAGQVPGGLGGQGTSMLVPTLLEFGTEEQKRTFIPADVVRRDDLVPALLRAERRLGSREPAHVCGPCLISRLPMRCSANSSTA